MCIRDSVEPAVEAQVRGLVADLSGQFGGEAVVMHILHPDEIELPDVDRGIFIDSESGDKVRVDVPEIRDAYHQKMQEFLDGWEGRCTALGIDYCRMDTTEPYWQALERYLIGRASVGR